MESLKNRILNCKACDLHLTRNNAVWGEGNLKAGILLIGEAPGYDEDRTGRPFVGRSGQLLDKILDACGFSREEHVFMSNVIRCRPPDNRVPTDKEVAACIPYLHKQIEIIDPKIIIPLGATALKRLYRDNSLKITRLRGTWMEWEGRQLMPLYHPSALLRNPALKRDTWDDCKKIISRYREIVNPDHYSAHY